MYRPKREWAWDEKAEQEYRSKREKLSEIGFTTDEEVCRYFTEKGVVGFEPEDIRPMMLDAITSSPLDRLLRSLQ